MFRGDIIWLIMGGGVILGVEREAILSLVDFWAWGVSFFERGWLYGVSILGVVDFGEKWSKMWRNVI